MLRYDISMMELPWTESPFFEVLLERRGLSDEEREQAVRFNKDGYLVIDVGLDNFDALAERVIGDLAPRYRDPDRRVTDGWAHHADILTIATAPKIVATLEMLYGREPIPFQTLNFDTGTEQPVHSDVIHFDSIPRRFMCGVWVALEDMDDGNGPLVYCPGSHKLPDYHYGEIGLPPIMESYPFYEQFMKELVERLGLSKEFATIRRGQALIWSANLLHGGSPITERGRTRHSQVTHYYFRNCTYYMPRLSQHPGRLRVREVIDIRTGEFQPHVFWGDVLDLDSLDWTWRYPRPLPPGFKGTQKQIDWDVRG